ncbi:MAG: PilZ domain-containing protein, partial [Candidatus Omnitrophica bacterium]|nr:PilZ domain-containing protein [Candidatus Omnitrophota bacterium]
MSRERRGFARLYIGVEAIYRRNGGQELENKVLVQDISLSGVRFISNEVLSSGDELIFTLNIPDISVPVNARGKVIWQKKFSESFYDTGIEFSDISDQLRHTLAAYIENALGRVEEHREFVRANLSTMVVYQCTDAAENRCISVDVSPTGLKVFMKEVLENGTLMRLNFMLPDDSQPIQAQGKIIWHKVRDDNFTESGIEFTVIDAVCIDKINAYVKKTLG